MGKNIQQSIKHSVRKLEKRIKKDNYKIAVIMLYALLFLLIINFFFVIKSSSILKEKVKEIKEARKPVNIEVVMIECAEKECSSLDDALTKLKSQNVNITKEQKLNESSAAELIEKYSIDKLPTILVFGEIDTDKIDLSDYYDAGEVMILKNPNPPFLDLESGQIKGEVIIKEIIDSSCEKCISLSSLPLSFSQAGVAIKDWRKIEYNSAEGKNLINKFGIKKVPSLLISQDIDYYEGIKEALETFGAENKNGFYIINPIQPPYRDLVQNKITGMAELIMITDESCTECYDVTINKRIIEGMGVVIDKESTFDVNSAEGKKLISKYNISKVPAILISPEAREYKTLVNAWRQVGSIEEDGWFVMRKPEVLGNIKVVENL